MPFRKQENSKKTSPEASFSPTPAVESSPFNGLTHHLRNLGRVKQVESSLASTETIQGPKEFVARSKSLAVLPIEF